MPIQTIFFDLDETIYPASSGIWPEIGRRIERYMGEVVRIPADQVTGVRKHYFHTYGTTLRGLQIEHQVDMHDYLAYVHDIPLANYLSPNPALREMLLNLPQRRLIFTNADRAHAGRVLAVLGLEGCFERIIDIHDIAPYCKPQPEAFALALRLAGDPHPRECLLVDDSAGNLQMAAQLGMYTVRVGSSQPPNGWDAGIESLAGLPAVLAAIQV